MARSEDIEKGIDTSAWLENDSDAYPPEIKRGTRLHRRWRSAKNSAYCFDDWKLSGIASLPPGFGDVLVTSLLAMLAHHYYNGYLAELDRQVVKQFGADSPEAETYRQEKEKHENDINWAGFWRFAITLAPGLGALLFIVFRFHFGCPLSTASRNIGKIHIKVFGHDMPKRNVLAEIKELRTQKPPPAYRQPGQIANSGSKDVIRDSNRTQPVTQTRKPVQTNNKSTHKKPAKRR